MSAATVVLLALVASGCTISLPIIGAPRPATTATAVEVTPQGPVDTSAPTNTATTPAVTPKPAPAVVTLSAKGIGPYKFGASKAKVSAYLTKALGHPKTDPKQDSVGQCEGGAGLWGTMEMYGELRVMYYGSSSSSKSPQTLASWTLMRSTKPKAPLALAKGIPTGLTMAQLKARYPKGGGLEYMGVWDTGGVLIGPAGKGDPGMMFAGLMDWCT